MVDTVWIEPEQFPLHGGQGEVGEVGLFAHEAVEGLEDVEAEEDAEGVHCVCVLLLAAECGGRILVGGDSPRYPPMCRTSSHKGCLSWGCP